MKRDWGRKYTQKYEVCLVGKHLGKEERWSEEQRQRNFTSTSRELNLKLESVC
jgi:hypothetical protein